MSESSTSGHHIRRSGTSLSIVSATMRGGWLSRPVAHVRWGYLAGEPALLAAVSFLAVSFLAVSAGAVAAITSSANFR